jgi:hypothetical protein
MTGLSHLRPFHSRLWNIRSYRVTFSDLEIFSSREDFFLSDDLAAFVPVISSNLMTTSLQNIYRSLILSTYMIDLDDISSTSANIMGAEKAIFRTEKGVFSSSHQSGSRQKPHICVPVSDHFFHTHEAQCR